MAPSLKRKASEEIMSKRLQPEPNSLQIETKPPEPPTLIPGRIRTSRRFLNDEFEQLIARLHSGHTLVGPLGGNGDEIKMPIQASDGRTLTWRKFAGQMIAAISEANAPLSRGDCWFLEGNEKDTSGYPVKKLAGSGEKNKKAVFRLAVELQF